MSRAMTRLFLSLAWLACFQGQPCSAAEAVPRYKLEVGQDLSYSGHDEFQYEGGKFLTDTTWRIWVVRKNDDGSWRLVVRHGSRFRQARDGGGGADRETVTFAWCDLSPDGSLTENDSFGFRMNPFTLLARLPADETTAKAGWKQPYRRMDEQNRYKLLADESTSQKMVIELRRESPMNAIYGLDYRDVMTFDCQRGLPEKIETETKQTYGFQGRGSGATKLDEVQSHDAEWCRGFWTDAERYFAAQQAFEKATEVSGRRADDFEKTLKMAAADFRSAKEQIKSPEFQKQIDDSLAEHERYAKYSLESARKQQALLDHPAAEWSCPGLDGKEHALKDYRGRIVVLDFWYRGCGWCIRAMPQMKEIAAHFQDKPVTIFGMNTDRVEEDARFVVDTLGLNYANLKATGVPEKYGVSGFPTLLIIDQEGVVRDIHEGYAPDLKEKVVQSIERLLKKS